MHTSDKKFLEEKVFSGAPFDFTLRTHYDWTRTLEEVKLLPSLDIVLDVGPLLDFISNSRIMFAPWFTGRPIGGTNIEIFFSESEFSPLVEFWIGRLRDLQQFDSHGRPVNTLLNYLTVLLVRRVECDLATAKKYSNKLQTV